MLFNSPLYIFVFLPVVVIVYFALNRHRLIIAGTVWLIAASLFFYAYWDPQYLLLILGSMLTNYAIGVSLQRSQKSPAAANAHADRKLHHPPTRKALFSFGILLNIGLLGYYKYAGFFVDNLNAILSVQVPSVNVVLPLAISFFTFTQLVYLVDCYRTDTQDRDFLSYILFVTFFPHLIAGPIVHHWQLMPQFRHARAKVYDWRNISTGLFIFALGLFKKVVIADSLAVWANAGFDSVMPLQFFSAWGTSLSYTLQLYYDFSGYSDMAIGAALLMNIRLPVNFNSPYRATSIQDFWRRWHITLSDLLRNYVYVPLGGNRKGPMRTYSNLMVTFLIGGLWHGAGWTFVVWGAMHGFALAIHRYWSSLGRSMSPILAWLITFAFVHFSWIFFRADSFAGAIRVLRGMFGLNGIERSAEFLRTAEVLSGLDKLFVPPQMEFVPWLLAMKLIIVFAPMAFLMPNTGQMVGLVAYAGRWRFNRSPRDAALFAGAMFASMLTFMGGLGTSEFLYFNF